MHYTPRSYVDWIIQVIKIKRVLDLEELSDSLLEGLKISLESGTTMVGDFLSDRRLLQHYENAEISGRVYLEFIGQDPDRYVQQLAGLSEEVHEVPSPFLAGIAPHAPFTVAKPFLQALAETARHKGVPLAMHLAESAAEDSFFRDASGSLVSDLYPFVGWNGYLPQPQDLSSTEWVGQSGALGPDFLAAHCVHVRQDDIELLKKAGCSVVLLPRSNANLAVGKAPAALLQKAGVTLALGTDSLASNDSLSLWDEMRFLLDTFPEVFSPRDALTMTTLNAAKAIRRDSDAGSLEAGKRADFLVMKPSGIPGESSVYEQLLDDAEIQAVFCGGIKTISDPA
jgi:cytosine/adenosine deaminase-related metal-dependent hydrolase